MVIRIMMILTIMTFMLTLMTVILTSAHQHSGDDHAAYNSMLTKIYILTAVQCQFKVNSFWKLVSKSPGSYPCSGESPLKYQWPTCWPACFFPSLGHLLPVCLMVQSSLLGAIWSVRWTQGHISHRRYPSFISNFNTRWLCWTKPWQNHGFQLT